MKPNGICSSHLHAVLHWATKPESIECLRVVAKFSANIGKCYRGYLYMFMHA